MLRDDTPDTGCGIKLFERDAFLDLPYFDHMHRYLPALMQRAGWQTVSVPVNHRARSTGVSKYNNLNRAPGRHPRPDGRGLADRAQQAHRRRGVLRMLEAAPVAQDFMNSPVSWLAWTGLHMSPWKLIGLTGR
jgi:hypothetical protein